MPGAAYLTKYVNIRDKNGVRVGDWAKQAEKGYATCTVCVPEKKIKFEKGSLELTRHSEREVHIKNSSKGTSNNNKSIFNFIADKEEDKIKSQAQDLEIILTTFMSRHSIPPELATCLTTLLKQYIPDSKIIQKMTLSSTKARYLTLRGLAEHAEKETSEKVRKCDACSIAIDESEVNGRSELEVMVKFASQEGGIENKHLGCIDLEEGDAETIKNSIFDFLDEKQIDFRTKMIDVGMDGCSTMQGHKSGVITRMVEDVEELQSTGSYKAHNLSNVMTHATEAFDPDVKDALVDVYIDLGGAKGYGLKKKKNFESLLPPWFQTLHIQKIC